MQTVLLRLVLLAALCIAAASAYAQAPPDSAGPAAAKVSSDIDEKAIWDGRKVVPFRALDDPKMVKAADADFLGDDEYVLGVTLGGESRAYPTRFAWFHHVINDKVVGPDGKETPFAVFYCSVCNTGIHLDPTVDGKPLKLDFYGLYNGVAILCDRESESVLLPVEGRMVKGPLTGTTIASRPLLDTTWKRWRALHPDTLVMSPDTPFQRAYGTRTRVEPRGYPRFPVRYFQPTVTRHDNRLPAFDKVLAVAVRADGREVEATPSASDQTPVLYRAYPIKTLQERSGVINDKLGKTPLVVLCELDTVTATAMSRAVDGKTLTFEVRKQDDGTSAFFDRETGSRWNVEGLAEDGPLKGKQLARLNNHLSQWYGWVASFPLTSIYGRKDPPQTVAGFEEEAPAPPPAPTQAKPDTPEPQAKPDGDHKSPDSPP